MADVTELNVETGEITERSFTPAEIADFERMRAENPAPVVHAVTRAQAKLWLHRAQKLAAVQAYIDGADDAELALWWSEADTFRRDNPYIVALAAGFDIDLDVAFTEAAGIG